MSVIRVDNFGPSAGGTTYSARGIAKAWVNFDGTGTIAARDSENVSSLTDNGTGDYTVNFTNAFGAADYCMSGNACDTSEASMPALVPALVAAPLATGNIRVQMRNPGTGTTTDFPIGLVSAHGDLA